jgi:hypothetical protein
MSATTRTLEIRAAFAQAGAAEATAAALDELGIPTNAINVQHNVRPEAREREARFVWGVLVAILLWSIAGAVPGAIFGWLLAETIGPEGAAGLIVQIVCWTIVGHLIGGMLAGYALLSDRSAEEMPPDRPISLLTVHGVPQAELRRARRLLRKRGALDVRLVE